MHGCDHPAGRLRATSACTDGRTDLDRNLVTRADREAAARRQSDTCGSHDVTASTTPNTGGFAHTHRSYRTDAAGDFDTRADRRDDAETCSHRGG